MRRVIYIEWDVIFFPHVDVYLFVNCLLCISLFVFVLHVCERERDYIFSAFNNLKTQGLHVCACIHIKIISIITLKL